MRAAQVAQAMSADIFVTARRYVFESSALRQSTVCFVGVEEALALIGLYLRSQGEFVVLGGRDRIELGRRHFYWVGARELLPEAWRWLAACTQRSHAAGDERPLYLGVSLLHRVERSLWARDDLHRASQRPQTGETSDLVLEALDRILLFLMGAVDAAARVAHIVLNLKGELRFAGWRQQEWYRALLKSDPALAAVVAPGSAHERALLILSRLRNSARRSASSRAREPRVAARPNACGAAPRGRRRAARGDGRTRRPSCVGGRRDPAKRGAGRRTAIHRDAASEDCRHAERRHAPDSCVNPTRRNTYGGRRSASGQPSGGRPLQRGMPAERPLAAWALRIRIPARLRPRVTVGRQSPADGTSPPIAAQATNTCSHGGSTVLVMGSHEGYLHVRGTRLADPQTNRS